MEGLEAKIASPATLEDKFKTDSSQAQSTYNDDTPASIATEDESYQIEENVAGNFLDSFYIGEISEKIDDSTYRVSYMSPKAVSTADYNKQKRRY